jgi:hypothetical protein
MKKLYVTAVLALSSAFLFAQQQEKCASMTLLHEQLQDENVANRMEMTRAAAAQWRADHPEGIRSSAPLLTIPVVVHVLYKTTAQNISDAQIFSQIAIMNEDYRRLNPDTGNTPSVFDSIAADMQIEFCLATRDPQGNPTNGITRTSTTGGQLFGFFSPIFEDAKYDSLGGKDAWPADQYLNIWVCEMIPGLLGYAQFPGGDVATDGVVISYQSFGDIGTVTAPSTLGRTTTHEVGHWLGLYHIWGDDSDCTGSDSIPDTPNASAASQSDCQVLLNSCSNEDVFWGSVDPADMVQNYMDYSHDSCMNMFTLGQKARAMSFLYTDSTRFGLFSSTAGCNALSVQESTFGQYFSVYPNPADGIVNVSYFGAWNPAMSIEVIDITGKTVSAYTTTAYSYTLDLSSLPAGVYTLKFTGSTETAMKKIVLQ